MESNICRRLQLTERLKINISIMIFLSFLLIRLSACEKRPDFYSEGLEAFNQKNYFLAESLLVQVDTTSVQWKKAQLYHILSIIRGRVRPFYDSLYVKSQKEPLSASDFERILAMTSKLSETLYGDSLLLSEWWSIQLFIGMISFNSQYYELAGKTFTEVIDNWEPLKDEAKEYLKQIKSISWATGIYESKGGVYNYAPTSSGYGSIRYLLEIKKTAWGLIVRYQQWTALPRGYDYQMTKKDEYRLTSSASGQLLEASDLRWKGPWAFMNSEIQVYYRYDALRGTWTIYLPSQFGNGKEVRLLTFHKTGEVSN